MKIVICLRMDISYLCETHYFRWKRTLCNRDSTFKHTTRSIVVIAKKMAAVWLRRISIARARPSMLSDKNCWASKISWHLFNVGYMYKHVVLAGSSYCPIKTIWHAFSIYRGHLCMYDSRKTTHSSPIRARNGASFVSQNLTAVLCSKTLRLGPRLPGSATTA